MIKKAAVYIVTNQPNGTLYIGVTNNLIRRIYEHKYHITKGFTYKYKCHRLIYYECFDNMYSAISREKQIKNYVRKKKLSLIESLNPQWRDLYDSIYFSG